MSHRNRLAGQTSPYLRQHADNPVDWYPWGDEAFERARAEDKPVLLSVGYSSCHWCHVMAHESFEDPDTATLLNERFVNVKVDREERPDVDAVYMEAVQAMTGHGGWPMTVFLLPDGRPFYGGTYFPKIARGGMLAFTDLCRRIDELWHTRRHDLEDQAGELADALGRELTPTGDDGTTPGVALVRAAVDELAGRFDPEWGGFGRAPKFPQPANLDLLLLVAARTGDRAPLAVATTTLDAMASGGIYDHLGGGFSRYSTDQRWMVPHFEKMLYDNALLAGVYLHAWQLTGQAVYRQVVDETIGYVLRDLRLPEGGLASAEDADSEGVEGRFSVWTDRELHDVLAAAGLAADEIDRVRHWWGVSGPPVFEGSHILWRPQRGDLLRPPVVERARRALFDHRARRVRPGLDDKALTEWNALFLSSLAEAAAATGSGAWLDHAVSVAEFLLSRLRRPDGRWLRAWQGAVDAVDPARPLAFAADLAAVVDAFTRLGEATGQARWTAEAVATADQLLELFWDEAHGGLFTVGIDAPQLFTRSKDLTDTATPSANSTAALAFVRLWARTGDARYRDAADSILRLVGPVAAHHPAAFGRLLAAADLLGHGVREVVIAGDGADLLAAVHATWRPQVVLAWGEADDSGTWLAREAGPDGAGLAYVCEDFTCQRPVSDPAELAALLDRR